MKEIPTPREFSNSLINLEQKCIDKCWQLIVYIRNLQLKNDKTDVPSQIFKKYLKNQNLPITKILQELENVGVFSDINRSYRKATNKKDSYCRKYPISEKYAKIIDRHVGQFAIEAVTDENLGKKFDKNRKKLQKSISVDDTLSLCESINNSLIQNLKYCSKALKNARENYKKHETIVNLAAIRLIMNNKISQINDVDGRLHTKFNQCPKLLRNGLSINLDNKILKNCGDLDIRSCVPTFFAHYIVNNLAKENEKTPELLSEMKLWNDFWCGNDHPREILAKSLGMFLDDPKQKQQLKKQLLAFFNTKNPRHCPIIRAWIKKNFPLLFKIWWMNDQLIEKTGTNIARIYEKTLMRGDDLYNFVQLMPIKILDCHDGISIFAEDNEVAETFSEIIREYIVDKSYRLFDIKPVLEYEAL